MQGVKIHIVNTGCQNIYCQYRVSKYILSIQGVKIYILLIQSVKIYIVNTGRQNMSIQGVKIYIVHTGFKIHVCINRVSKFMFVS